ALAASLAQELRRQGGDPLGFLFRAQHHFLGDFWLNFELGNQLGKYLKSRSAEAVSFYRAALVVRPDPSAVWNHLGLGLMRLSVGDAIVALERGVALHADSMTWGNLGLAYQKAGRNDEAEKAYRRALVAEPDSAWVSTNLATVLMLRGKKAE